MGDLMEAITERRSVRSYKSDPVPREMIFDLIDAARWAPSGANLQPWHFIAVTDRVLKSEIGRHCKFFFIKSHHVDEAPMIIAILGDSKKSAWATVDCAMAAQNLMLRAHEIGLGTCFIGAFDEPAVRKLLSVPDKLLIVGLITVGYPAALTKPTPRLDVTAISSFESYLLDDSLTSKINGVRKSGLFSIFRKGIKAVLRL